MRKRVLGTIAALTAGAGGAFAESPKATAPPPSAIAPVVPFDGGLQPAGGPAVGGITPPQFGPYGPTGPMMPPGGDPREMGPAYPQGLHGQQAWEDALSQNGPAAPAASRFYMNSQYLLFFVKAQPANFPFVTTSAPQDAGLPGRPTTTRLFSDTDLGYDLFSGFNITVGYYKDPNRRLGFEIGGLLLERKTNSFLGASDANGIPLLARPFVDATTGSPAVLTVAQQGLASGSVRVSSREEFYGGEVNCLANLYRSCPGDGGVTWNVDGLVGFRYFEIHEDLRFDSASTILGTGALFNGAAILPGATVQVNDTFNVFNRFYGGQIGTNVTASWGKYSFSGKVKVAGGLMAQQSDIDGRSTLTDVSRNLFAQGVGGLYANAQNIGRTRHDEFAVIPEVGATFGYQWTSWFSTSIGYTFIGVDRVLRPGNVVSNVVSPGILPTSQSFGAGAVATPPAKILTQDEWWAQGVTFQMLFKY